MGDKTKYPSIQIKYIIIGDVGIGKKAFISRMNNISCSKSYSKDLPGILSSKILEYNLNATTVFIQAYIAKGATPIDYLEESSSSDDEEIKEEYKVKFKDTKNSIIEMLKFIGKNAENDPNALQETIFIFMYDMSDFSTFERLLLYYDSISRKFGLKGNSKCFVIGNKIDRRVVFKNEEYDKINSFLKVDNFKKYDISTKVNFAFKHFFYDLVTNSISSEVNYNKEKFKSILNNKTNLSKTERKGLEYGNNDNPEPGKYNVNIYDFDSMEQRNEILNDKKNKFSKKIFVNKKSPVYSPFGIIHEEEEYRKKEFAKLEEKRIQHLNRIQSSVLRSAGSDIMNNSLKRGVSFSGTSCSSLNNIYILERNKKIKERDLEYFNSFDENKISNLHRPFSFRPKSKNYFAEIDNRRYQYQQNLNNNLKEKESKFEEQRKKNIEEINNNILERSMKILSKYENYDPELEKKKSKERYLDIVYGNNAFHLDKLNNKIEEINLLRKSEEIKPKIQYDIRGNMLNPKKGRSITGKPKSLIVNENNAKLYYIKDDFEKIVDKSKEFSGNYSPRYRDSAIRKKIEQTKIIDNSKFIKYEKNRLSSAKRKNLEEYFKELRLRKKKQDENYKLIKDEENEYHQLLLNDYYRRNPTEDGKYPPSINYSQVEDKSPAFTIRGRNEKKKKKIGNSYFSILNNIDDGESYLPYPDINKVKPNMNGFTFGKEERFKDIIKENEIESESESEEKLFGSEDKKSFSNIQPYDAKSKRSDLYNINNNPGPGHYNLRGFAEEIVESAYKRYTGKNENEEKKVDKNYKNLNDEKKVNNTQEIIIDENREYGLKKVENDNNIINNNVDNRNVNVNNKDNLDIINIINQKDNIEKLNEKEEQKEINVDNKNNQINNNDLIDFGSKKNENIINEEQKKVEDKNQNERFENYMDEESKPNINKEKVNIENSIKEENIISGDIQPLESENKTLQKPKTQNTTVPTQEKEIEYSDKLEGENDNNIDNKQLFNENKQKEEEIIDHSDNLESKDNKKEEVNNNNKEEFIEYYEKVEQEGQIEKINENNNNNNNKEGEVIEYNENIEKEGQTEKINENNNN